MSDFSHLLRPARRPAWRVWLLAAALLAAGAWLLADTLRLRAAQERLEQAQAQERKLQERARADERRARNPDADKLRQLIAQEQEFPWESIFQGLEQAAGEDIGLLELVPDKLTRVVILRGVARNHEALIDYLERLERQPAWMQVHLTRQKNEARDGLQTLSFEIKASIRKR